jgi:hypothetical protein
MPGPAGESIHRIEIAVAAARRGNSRDNLLRMAISHTCAFCGRSLTRIRPVLEPHYGLRLVCCPDCGRACVRRRHPISRGWRAFLRVKASLLMLLVQLFVALAMGYYTVWLARILGEAARYRTLSALFDPEEIHIAYAMAIVPAVTGVWLAGALSHLRRVVAWSAWAGWCALLLMVFELGVPLMSRARRTGDWHVASADLKDSAWALDGLAILLALSAAVIPLGAMLARAFEEGRRTRWRRRRRRWRAERATA